jgi:hypothetical protein
MATQQRLLAWASALTAFSAAGCSAAAAKPPTLKLLEVAHSFVGEDGFNANSNKPPAVGQGVVIKGRLYKLAGHIQRARVGGLHVECTFTDSTGSSVCVAALTLPQGKLVVSGRIPANPTIAYALPIVGGSGTYAHVKGHVAINPIGNSNKAVDTIVLTG